MYIYIYMYLEWYWNVPSTVTGVLHSIYVNYVWWVDFDFAAEFTCVNISCILMLFLQDPRNAAASGESTMSISMDFFKATKTPRQTRWSLQTHPADA